MTTSDNIFELIKSLSPSEKGYIKKLSSFHPRGGQNQYVKLLDAIDRQTIYDEKELLKKFKGESFINNFSVAKNYLYNYILKGLESYHKNVRAEIRSYLNQVEILENKNLSTHCEKLLEKSKKLALKYELFELLEEIVEWEIHLISRRTPNEKNHKQIITCYDELFDILLKKDITLRYKKVSSLVYSKMHNKGQIRSLEETKEYREIIEQGPGGTEHTLRNFKAKLFCLLANSNYYLHINEYEKSYHYTSRILKLWEDNAHMIETNLFNFFGCLINKGVCELKFKKYGELDQTLDKINEYFSRFHPENNYLRLSLFNFKFYVSIFTGQQEKGLEIAGEIEKHLVTSRLQEEDKKASQLFHFGMSCLYIGIGDYKSANKYVNIVLNDYESDLRSDLYCFSHVLSIIIHFELGNRELLEYRVKSTYRLLLKRNKLYKVESLILNFIKDTIGVIHTEEEQRQAFISLRDKMVEATVDNRFEEIALDYFDFISWLESKIENRSFREIKRRKFLAHLEQIPPESSLTEK
jgi:hypothetical protein